LRPQSAKLAVGTPANRRFISSAIASISYSLDRKSNDRHIMLFYRGVKCPQDLARSWSGRLSHSHETLSMQLEIVYFGATLFR
jgi:hypothetical protein